MWVFSAVIESPITRISLAVITAAGNGFMPLLITGIVLLILDLFFHLLTLASFGWTEAMGVIEDGSISGFLPSTKLFAVHYPGYPSSVTRAVETLGGTDGIVKVCNLYATYSLVYK